MRERKRHERNRFALLQNFTSNHTQMLRQATASQSAITLAGSAKIVVEYLHHAVNSILYQRGLYPPEDFSTRKQYGLSLFATNDPALESYLSRLFQQLQVWLKDRVAEKCVLVVQSVHTRQVLERWTFHFHLEDDAQMSETCVLISEMMDRPVSEKSEAEVHKELQAVMRQITASVTFLPMLEEKCTPLVMIDGAGTFNLLIYADKNAQVPLEWIDSDPMHINNADQVRLRSFSTGLHRVDTAVSYKFDPDNQLT